MKICCQVFNDCLETKWLKKSFILSEFERTARIFGILKKTFLKQLSPREAKKSPSRLIAFRLAREKLRKSRFPRTNFNSFKSNFHFTTRRRCQHKFCATTRHKHKCIKSGIVTILKLNCLHFKKKKSSRNFFTFCMIPCLLCLVSTPAAD